MEEDNVKALTGRLLFGRNERPGARQPMTRGQQTGWIIGAMVVIAGLAYNYANTHDKSDPYASCNSFFENNPTACRAQVAMERLNAAR